MENLELLEQAITYALARKDPYTFLTAYVKTVDERDGQVKPFPSIGNEKLCVKCKVSYPLPDEEKESLEFGYCPICEQELKVAWAYLKGICDCWRDNLNVLIPKTRQMMISWTFVALHLWLALRPNTFIIFQSETEDKAKELIKRLTDIYVRLPVHVKQELQLKRPASLTEYWFENGSRIKAVPQGVTQITGLTPSAVFSDEMGIQAEAELAYVETRPALAGGGRFTGVSTPAGKGFFYKLVADKKEGDTL